MLFDLSGGRKRVSALAATAVSAWLLSVRLRCSPGGGVGTVTDAESLAPVAARRCS